MTGSEHFFLFFFPACKDLNLVAKIGRLRRRTGSCDLQLTGRHLSRQVSFWPKHTGGKKRDTVGFDSFYFLGATIRRWRVEIACRDRRFPDIFASVTIRSCVNGRAITWHESRYIEGLFDDSIRAYFLLMYSRLKLHLFGIFFELFDICSSMIFKKEREMGEWSRFLNIK